jgi:predicted NBD/HSP70 family sugar kinase
MGADAGVDRHELVRRAHVEAVHKAVREHGPISREELVSVTGLSRPTVIGILAALAAAGEVRPAAVDQMAAQGRGAGRVATLVEINPRARCVVGVDLGGTRVRAVLGEMVGDAPGAILARAEEQTTRRGGAAVVRQVASLVAEVAARAGVTRDDVAAVGIGTPGIEMPDGRIRLAENVPGLSRLALVPALRDALQCAVIWDNDVNMAALGELRHGVAKGVRSFALVSVGTGVGCGVVVDGRVLRGGRGAAGEIAFLPYGSEPGTVETSRRGAFEVAASGSGVMALYAHSTEGSIDLQVRNAEDVYAAAATGDPRSLGVVARHGEILAEGIAAVGAVLDPELVVLAGGVGANPLLLPSVRAALRKRLPWSLRVESSGLGEEAGVIGAVHRAGEVVPGLPVAEISARLATRGGR